MYLNVKDIQMMQRIGNTDTKWMVHFRHMLYQLIVDGSGDEHPKEWLEEQKDFLLNVRKGFPLATIPERDIDHEAIEWFERCYEELRFFGEMFKPRLWPIKPLKSKGEKNVQNNERGSSL